MLCFIATHKSHLSAHLCSLQLYQACVPYSASMVPSFTFGQIQFMNHMPGWTLLFISGSSCPLHLHI